MAGTVLADAVVGLNGFLDRLRQRGLGRQVVLHTSQRSYVGKLIQVDAASVGLNAESLELDERCQLEVDPQRIEAFEVFRD